jgi:AmmeMemoRadiSam system protein B
MNLRPSPIAGRWYPGQADRLAASIDDFLDKADAPPPEGDVVGLIAPHAGHVYSGAVAAHAFKTVRGQAFDIVAIISPSHFHDDGLLLTSGHAAYATPLGEVPVDRAAVEQLRAELGPFGLVAIRRDQEHAIEIELPFLQRALSGEFALLPVMVREQSAAVARALGVMLAKVLAGKRALIVGSSDLAHFQSQDQTNALDAVMLKQIEAFDPEGVERAQDSGRGFACGYGAVMATLWAARALGADHAHVLTHATSGDVNGDYSSVVGYGAAVLWKES